MRADTFQKLLIFSGLAVTTFFTFFIYREMFPEYKIYQNDYVDLEKFRSTYTGKQPPDFSKGVKQIVLEREDNGPPLIDRCTSCHVALQIPYFSPTQTKQDINGNIILDAKGNPVLFPNDDYIWVRLENKIAELRDEKVNAQLSKEGHAKEVSRRLHQADLYEGLKTAKVGDYVYDVRKVLSMHPLIGKETRPFEFHPVEEYGCTSCHNGNGRGLVTDKAHGPVFDRQYDAEYEGPVPGFTETDFQNDPPFARIFNHKPGEALIFQTNPIFVGPLIQSKCMQCHQTSRNEIESAIFSTSELSQQKQKNFEALQHSFEKDQFVVLSLLQMQEQIREHGYGKTIEKLKQQKNNLDLSSKELNHYNAQEKYLEKLAEKQVEEVKINPLILHELNQNLVFMIGSPELVETLQKDYSQIKHHKTKWLDTFVEEHLEDPYAKGELFGKAKAINYEQDIIRHAEEAENTFSGIGQDQKFITALQTDVDELTQNYQKGETLYFSQACYACHRIAGLSRGGIGPELTKEGYSYPWFIKESIVWPQADTPSSTMPNMRLDHDELQDLVTFLLAQKGGDNNISKMAYQSYVRAWEGGKKTSLELPVPAAKLHDLRYSMTVFATEGCASCHRLMGFESNTGFTIEKKKHSFEELYAEQQWFKQLFPELVHIAHYDEQLPGSYIVGQIEKHANEIDARISSHVREGSILDEIEKKHPGTVEALYSNFKFATRAKDHFYMQLLKEEKNPEKQAGIKQQYAAWKERVHRVLMIYVQIYGLGRLIGPRPNWSGLYRTDEWLMEHFRNPSSHVPRSIMPIMPFDDTKFLALTSMLDVLAPRNRDALQNIWALKGFDPEEAYNTHCSQCHGETKGGNGPVSEWIYPIPKNLRNPDFLRSLTKERAIYSITHGVAGTPMPPWGEVAKDKSEEIQKLGHDRPVLSAGEIRALVDWLYSYLPGAEVIRGSEVPKWKYTPQDVIEELKQEGSELKGKEKENLMHLFPTVKKYYVALNPKIYSPSSSEEEKIFDILSNEEGGPDLKKYYIKKQFYTHENIEAGKEFFLINCAACHGNEGDGTGVRALAMDEAKPRMLTNLDWASSKDDLRLLRSIKYGVPGTAMTPWGDLTSSLQRLQLVIFIRTLTLEKEKRDQLNEALYQAFEIPKIDVDNAWEKESKQLITLTREHEEIKEKLREIEQSTLKGKTKPEEALDTYKRNLEIDLKINQLDREIQLFQDLKIQIKKEKDLYLNLGEQFINNKNISEKNFQTFLEIIFLSKDLYSLQNDQLVIKETSEIEEQIKRLQKDILDQINHKIASFEEDKKKEGIKEEINNKTLSDLQGHIDALAKLKIRLITGIDDALQALEKQKEILKNIYPSIISDKTQNKRTK